MLLLAFLVVVKRLKVARLLILDEGRQYHIFFVNKKSFTFLELRGLLKAVREHLHEHGAQNSRQVSLDEVGNEVSIDAVAIANAKHPQTVDPSQILYGDKAVLVGFGLRGDETLSCFHCKGINDRGFIKRYSRCL